MASPTTFPIVNATFPLFEAPNLAKAQQGYRLLTTLRWVLPLLTIALFVAGVWVARGRRRALLGAALGLSGAMLVLGAALLIARSIYLNSVPRRCCRADAAAAAYDTLIRFLRDGLRVLFVVGLVIAAGAFFTGPAAAAVRTRHAVTSGSAGCAPAATGPGCAQAPSAPGRFEHKTLLRIAAVGVVALIFLFWGQPTRSGRHLARRAAARAARRHRTARRDAARGDGGGPLRRRSVGSEK